MPQVVVKKVVGVLFLEAAKLTLDHLAEHRLRETAGEGQGADVTRLYGELRHLRDTLTRSLVGSSDQVTLELSAHDAALLVAAMRRLHEVLDDRIVADQRVTPDEKLLIQRKRHLLGDWAYELAAMPLVELPLPPINVVSTGAVRALRTRISGKSYRPPTGAAAPADSAAPPAGEPAAGGQIPTDRSFPGGRFGGEPGRRAGATAGIPSLPGLFDEPPREGPSGTPYGAPEGASLDFLDPRTIRDPRLRALTQMDLASLERALQVDDHRVALVLLGSILEAITIDHAESRRQQFALSGGPESWNLVKLLELSMGEAFEIASRQTLLLLANAPNLLRPAQQMSTPIVVTAALIQQALEFTRLAARALGFAADPTSGQRGPGVAPAF